MFSEVGIFCLDLGELLNQLHCSKTYLCEISPSYFGHNSPQFPLVK